MNELVVLAQKYPSLNVTVGLADLIEFGRFTAAETRREVERQITDAKAETYPGADKVAEILDVNKTTLWRWHKRGYLVPIEIGGKRRYRMSDINRILKAES